MTTEDRLDAAIDASLKRRFGPPNLDGLVDGIREKTRLPAPWRRWRAAAAAVLIGFAVGWIVWGNDEEGGGDPSMPSPGTPTENLMASLGIEEIAPTPEGSIMGCGWVNELELRRFDLESQPWAAGVCTTETFESRVQKALGHALTVPPTCEVTTPKPVDEALVEFSTVINEKVVMVFLCKEEPNAEPPRLPTGADINCWRRRVGPLVAYEVSRLKRPHVLPQLTQPRP